MAELCFRNGGTLDKRLTREIHRVEKLIPKYEAIGKPGEFTLALIRHTIKAASEAMVMGLGVERCMKCYRVLVGIK